MDNGLRLVVGDWITLEKPATKVRFEVFVDEQQFPAEMEIDEFDAVSLHAVAFDAAGEAVATGRLLPDGHIGRMAVVKSARGTGVGGMVLQALIDAGQQHGFKELVLSAQTHALGFYGRYGFVAEGDIYLDSGVDHQTMRLVL
ncbi:GNAT family N-acetyltransferase [Pelistega europaea]|uniref:GNAT family N-acetyltransferase n=1 Tax=Pelistega europaea TaxID=106147 RepID=A0A7Y4P695_9BURK|nr:GNAT family N-acetyltransferase [Pelistega europaea]NOL49694.1 GNAT family N-acetyltransferase [Pelistega europaea]